MVPKTHQWNDKRDPGLPHYVSSSGKWRKCNVPKQQEHLSGGKPPSLTRGILSDFQWCWNENCGQSGDCWSPGLLLDIPGQCWSPGHCWSWIRISDVRDRKLPSALQELETLSRIPLTFQESSSGMGIPCQNDNQFGRDATYFSQNGHSHTRRGTAVSSLSSCSGLRHLPIRADKSIHPKQQVRVAAWTKRLQRVFQ